MKIFITVFISFYFLGLICCANPITNSLHQKSQSFISQKSPLLEPDFRPPAVPLIVFDPYMSIWSLCDKLSDSLTSHWSGAVMNIGGLILIDNNPFMFMGFDTFSTGGQKVPPMTQTNLTVYPTQTIYTFNQNGVTLILTFTTPSLLTNISLWSAPISHITYTVFSSDGKPHNVSVMYQNTGEVAVNDVQEEVTWSRNSVNLPGLTTLRIGTTAQNIFGTTGDGVRINWGYYYVVVNGNTETSMSDWQSVGNSFSQGKPLPPDSGNNPRKCSDAWPVLAVAFRFGTVTTQPVSERVLIAYDDIKSIRYFGNDFPGYWRKDSQVNQPATLLQEMYSSYDEILRECSQFDRFLVEQLNSVGGSKYATIASLAYRQVTGSCKVVYNTNLNTPWVFMKEISSDGDVSTVDVIFPASPMFFYLNTELVDLMLRPILEYAVNHTSVKYNLPWAPHHLGAWPVCDILPQNQEQMPVEETGNMLMMLTKIATFYQSVDFLNGYWDLLDTWGIFLTTNLPDPPKQLCTDDFEGPSAHNVNLAAKGIVGLACYAKLLRIKGDVSRAQQFETLVTQYANFWLSKAETPDHYIRAYDVPGSWSLKYNLAYIKYLDLQGIFPEKVFEIESSYYISKLNKYGTPLDERANFTLLEYMGAIQSVLVSDDQRAMFIDCTYKWANETPDRVPLSDWYDTITGHVVGFRARSTVGNLYTNMIITPNKK